MLSIAPFSLGGRMGVIRRILLFPFPLVQEQFQVLLLLISYALEKDEHSGESFQLTCGA